jgi:general secretion pathway protein B
VSYILEALRRSEIQRQQGRVPGLNAAPVSLGSARVPPAGVPLRWVAAAGVVLLALAAAVFAWWQPWKKPAPEADSARSPAVAKAPAALPGQREHAARMQPAEAVPPLLAAQSAVPASTSAMQTAPAREAAEPEPPAPRPSPRPAPVEPGGGRASTAERLPPARPTAAGKAAEPAPARVVAVEPKPATAPAHAAPLKAQVPPAAEADARPAGPPPKRVLHFAELPAALRQAVPKIAITGSSYSDEPDSRIAVINDKVLKEGEEVAPGLLLESIGADGIVLKYRGYRFRPAP